MINNKRILVLGSTGFVGKQLLSNNNFLESSVFAVSRKKDDSKKNLIVVDLTDNQKNIENLFIDYDIIINCSGELKDNKKMEDLHVKAHQKIINYLSGECLKRKKKIRWVQLSSVGVFGFSKDSKVEFLTENSPTNPSNVYEKTKLQSEKILINNKNDFFEYNILRASTIYGKDMKSDFIQKLKGYIKKNLFFYIGSKETIFNIIHVKDVADALVECARGKVKNEIFNLSNDCKLNELVFEICKLNEIKKIPNIIIPELIVRFIVNILGKFIKINLDDRIINILISRRYIKSEKIKNVLGFHPKIILSEGIKDTLI